MQKDEQAKKSRRKNEPAVCDKVDYAYGKDSIRNDNAMIKGEAEKDEPDVCDDVISKMKHEINTIAPFANRNQQGVCKIKEKTTATA